MKRRLPVLLALLVTPLPTWGSIAGTAHDTELGGEGGACTACHIPHQAAGDKFWAQEPVYAGKVGAIAALCGSCHHSGEGYGAVMTRAHSDDYVYGPASHGQKMYLADPPPGTDSLASGLPDIEPAHGYFECTTCHSVHDDTYRPFLREPPNALCARCHRHRHYVDGLEQSGPGLQTGKWGVPDYMGASNPGSHPVGEDVVGDRTNRPVVTIPSLFKVPFTPQPGRWSLGGHLTGGSDGGVTCITCHAVHGRQLDPDDVIAGGSSAPPGPGFLVVAQTVDQVTGSARPVPNGAGDASRLCEACHGVDNNPVADPGGSGWSDPDHNVSPGKLNTYSHPVDSYPSSVDANVGAFPTDWPEGDPALAGDNVAPAPICETCHAPHPAAALAAGRVDVRPGAAAYVLRAPLSASGGEPLCEMCHIEEVEDHHPVDRDYDSTGVPYLDNATGGSGDVLTCSTCHTTAHGWVEPGWAGLDPGWLPYDNGRRVAQAGDMYNPDMSKTCMDCHYFMDGDGASVSPTMGSRQTVIDPSDDEYIYYQTPDQSMGTHYIGRIHEGESSWQLNPLIDMYDTGRTWFDQSPGAQFSPGLAPGWARFGGEDRDGSRVLVCESCHELEPDKNWGFRHLLLAPYEEGQNGVDEYTGDTDGHDILCEACHGVPRGTHPVTGDVISGSKAPLNTREKSILQETLGHATMDRELHALSCDSCHQPHDANSNSYTFILDAPDDGPIGQYDRPPIEAGPLDGARPSEHSKFGYEIAGNGVLGTYATPTLQDKGGAHAGFCKQCHNK